MSRYGYDYYAESYYGANNPLKLSVLPFTATPGAVVPVGATSSYSNYGTITLQWSNPSGLWSNLVLVRNAYGFPVNAYDGTQVYSAYNDGKAAVSFIDTGLAQGAFYYYSIYLFNTVQYTWTNAGNVIGLSVKDFSNSKKLYSYLPDIYKISNPYTPTTDWDNPLLQQFLNNFAFQLDWDQTLTQSLINRYDVTAVSGQLIPSMLNQFGQNYESAIGLQQNRILLRDSVILTKQRGSKQGLIGYLEDFTGWAIPSPVPESTFVLGSNNQYVPVAPTTTQAPNPSLTGLKTGVNLMLDYNDSSFEESFGHWGSIDGTADYDQIDTFNIASVSLTSNVVTLNLQNTNVTYTITSASITNNIATLTTSFNHNILPGVDITVANVGLAYNGQQTVLSVTSNTISFSVATATAATTTVTGSVVQFVHIYDVGNSITISNLPYPILNTGSTPVQITALTATTLSFALTAPNIPLSTGYNAPLGVYGTLAPYPTPAVFDANGVLNGSSTTLWPNKSSGIFSMYNTSATAQTISAYCGDSAPVTQGIPVTGNSYYTWSFYAANGYAGTARNVTPIIKWFTRTGAYISSSSGTAVSDNTATFSSSYRPYVTAQAPSNAYYACPGVSIASAGGSATNEHHFVDACQFELTSLGATPSVFDEARNLHITFKATRINELLNPHFASTSNWYATNASTALVSSAAPSLPLLPEPNQTRYVITNTSIASGVVTVTVSEPHTLQVGSTVYISSVSGTGVTAANYLGYRTITGVVLPTNGTTYTGFTFSVSSSINQASVLSSGTAYTAGHELQVTASGTSASISSWDGSTTSQQTAIYYPNNSYTWSVYAQAITDTESLTASITWYDITHTVISTATGTAVSAPVGSWVRPYVTATAPSNAAYATAKIAWTTTSGNKVYFDMALFEKSGLLQTYFDGSGGPGFNNDFYWEGGNLNAGRSHFYKNFYNTRARLVEGVVQGALLSGQTAAVYFAQPQT